MVELDEILKAIDRHKRPVLACAETALAPHAFKAFRKVFLDEFGNSGLVKDLHGLYGLERRKSR
jgi:hypothetical protein